MGGILIWLIAWLSNFSFGGRSYRATFLFPNVGGLMVGTRISYQGSENRTSDGNYPRTGGVAVEVEISARKSPNSQ
jgi:phospholipid/cholesterol/gamma-HCH transport system substrate-binding protein